MSDHPLWPLLVLCFCGQLLLADLGLWRVLVINTGRLIDSDPPRVFRDLRSQAGSPGHASGWVLELWRLKQLFFVLEVTHVVKYIFGQQVAVHLAGYLVT